MEILSTALKKKQIIILNNKFQSVFTQENTTNILNCNSALYPVMPDLDISCDGAQNFLETLDPSKVPGPDNIPTRILRFCAKEISPVLNIIFVQSLTSRHTPKDWLTANYTYV